jgi:sugar phosphate isomerase/epimerase
MENDICLATGSIFRWNNSRNKLIDYCKKFEIDGVELTLGPKPDLKRRMLSQRSIRWLKKKSHVSIHAPFGLSLLCKDMDDLIKDLKYIQEIYDRTEAKAVVIHPHDIPHPDILEDFDFKILTENMPPGYDVTYLDIGMIMKALPKSGLCLDLSHAYLYSGKETGKLVKRFRKNICQFHLSGTYRKKDHVSLRKVTKNFKASLGSAIKLDVPVIVEEFITRKNFGYVRNEIKEARKIFSRRC